MGQTDSGQKRQRWDKQIAVRRDRDGPSHRDRTNRLRSEERKRLGWDKQIAVRRDRETGRPTEMGQQRTDLWDAPPPSSPFPQSSSRRSSLATALLAM